MRRRRRWLLLLVVLSCCVLLTKGEDDYVFWEACERGDVAAMESVLSSSSTDVNFEDDSGRTPLLLAVLNRQVPAVRWLLQHGADVERPGRWPGPAETPLAVAATRGDLESMEVLVVEGSASFGDALVAAAANGQTAAVEWLVGVGVEVNKRREDGTTALFWAAKTANVESLQLLLDAGADVTLEDSIDGSTALHYASSSPCVEALLRAGADVEARSSVLGPTDRKPRRDELRGGVTPLMAAAATGSLDALKTLVDEGGADVNAFDVSGMTALAWGCAGANSDGGQGRRLSPHKETTAQILQELVDRGAKDESATVDGLLLLHVAAAAGNVRAIAWLVDTRQHAVDEVSSLRRQQTPLFVAAEAGSTAAVKALVKRGANVDFQAPKNDDATPLHAASAGGYHKVASLLLKSKANPLLRSSSGQFPSEVAPEDTPQGRALRRFLAKAEREAFAAHREAFFAEEEALDDDVDDLDVDDLDESVSPPSSKNNVQQQDEL